MSTFVLSNRNIVIPGPAGTEPCRLAKGCMGPVPDWVPKMAYFKALEADGKVVLSQPQRKKDKPPKKPKGGEEADSEPSEDSQDG